MPRFSLLDVLPKLKLSLHWIEHDIDEHSFSRQYGNSISHGLLITSVEIKETLLLNSISTILLSRPMSWQEKRYDSRF